MSTLCSNFNNIYIQAKSLEEKSVEVTCFQRLKEAEASSACYQVGVFSDTVPTVIRVCRISSI